MARYISMAKGVQKPCGRCCRDSSLQCVWMHALARNREALAVHTKTGWVFAQPYEAMPACRPLPAPLRARHQGVQQQRHGRAAQQRQPVRRRAPGRAPGPAAQAPLHLHRGPQPVPSKVLQPGAPTYHLVRRRSVGFGSCCSCSSEGAECQMVTARTIRPELRVCHWRLGKATAHDPLHAGCHK